MKAILFFLCFMWVGYYVQEVIVGWARTPFVITWAIFVVVMYFITRREG